MEATALTLQTYKRRPRAGPIWRRGWRMPGPDHPLNEPWMWPPFLDAMDRVIGTLVRAQPLRLSRNAVPSRPRGRLGRFWNRGPSLS
jgi:hypothetical protein